VSIETVISQLQQMKSGGLPTPAAPAPVAADVRRRTDKVSMSIAIPPACQGLEQLWPALVEAAASRLTLGFLAHGHPVSLEKQTLTIQFPAEDAGQVHLVDADALNFLRGKLADLGQPNTDLKFVVAEEEQAVAPPPPKPVAMAAPAVQPKPEKPAPQKLNVEDFKNDPLIQKALEIFRGHIVEVRAGI
jgi:hypothetical protein